MKYSAYKDTGIKWLPKVPEHWDICKLGQLLKHVSEKNHSDYPLLSVIRDKGVIVRDVEDKDSNHNYVPDDLANYKVVQEGQFVVNKMKAWQGSYGVSKYQGIVSPAYYVFSIDFSNLFFFNCAIRSKAYISFFGQASDGIRVDQWDLSLNKMKQIPFFAPPRSEQDQIVRYLDWKVGKIDRLIALKKRQIECLQDLKKAVVNEAVTKGLNPDVELVDSGVPWLGKIPKGWSVAKLRSILRPYTEKNRPDLPLLSVVREKGVIVRDVDNQEDNHNFIPDDLSGYKVVKKHQFVMNKMKAWQGSYGISSYEGIVSPAYFVFDINFRNLEYFHFAIRSKVYINFFASVSDGIRVGQWDLSMDKMKEILFVVPSEEEQEQIVTYLEKSLKQYDVEMNVLDSEIDKLQELRTRLIADVVTGQADVRGVKVPEEVAEDD